MKGKVCFCFEDNLIRYAVDNQSHINSHCVLSIGPCERSAVCGSGFDTSILETPDPASYWSLNEICKYRGNGMKLLIFDTGIRHESHPSFTPDPEIYRGIEMFGLSNCDDLDGHGTCCAGIACGNELKLSIKCRGVAPYTNLVIWKGYEYVKMIPIHPWLQQLERMALECVGVDVVVISSGFEQPDERMEDAIKELDKKGVIVVCAAGNDGAKDLTNIKYPARYPQTICVGAHDRNGHPCGFSSVGDEIDVLALGGDIVGPKPVDTNLEDSNNEKYLMKVDGTSFAAPAVGALICLILQAVKDTCIQQHYDRIKRTEPMKKLLQKLATKTGVISRKQLDKFFNDNSNFYLGPQTFIREMIASREI